MKRKTLLKALACLALLVGVPALAVFNERSLSDTIHSLRLELKRDYEKRVASEKRFAEQYRSQRRDMVSIIKKCNELSLMLYSQKQDYTFDITYALQSVSREYEEFQSRRLPYDQIVNRLDWDIDRYARLVESLRRIPPEMESVPGLPDSLAYHNDSLDTRMRVRPMAGMPDRRPAISDSLRQNNDRPFLLEGEETMDRDSCIFYAAELLKMSAAQKRRIVADSTHYQRAFLRLKESYDYAQQRYKQLQNRIFVQGQTPYNRILKGFGVYWKRAAQDCKEKYSFGDLNAWTRRQHKADTLSVADMASAASDPDKADDVDTGVSQWRGPLLLWSMLFQLLTLLALMLVCWGILRLLLLIKPIGKVIAREQHFSFVMLAAIIINSILMIRTGESSNFIASAKSLMGTYLWLLGAIVAAQLIRLKPEQLKGGLRLYLPMMVMAVLVISLRIVFMPNSMMNIVFPPLLLVFFIWQLCTCLKFRKSITVNDRIFGWLSLTVTGAALLVSLFGYIFVGLLIMLWWFFLMAIALTLYTIYHLMDQFKSKHLGQHVEEYKKSLTFVSAAERDNLIFGATWFYDLLKSVLLPVLALLALPLSLRMALGVFDFSDLFEHIFTTPFVNLTNAEGVTVFRLSFKGIVIALALFFLFRYLNYALYSLYLSLRYASYMKKHGRKTVRKDEINFSLGKSIINTLVWLVYIVIIILMLRIPTTSLTIIAGGLSAGIGIAMKDIINNFIYGIQLMSGRLRVGDWIECDGVRGKVTAISYQSTQIETVEGAVMSFLNEALFNKNFRNLTHNHAYELVKIIVGVSYGTDVEKVRGTLIDAMQVMRTKDNYGREVVDPKKGIYVAFDAFDESSVNIAVKQYVLVAERTAYVDKAKEVIYDALNAAGISIPFPQRDIHVVQD